MNLTRNRRVLIAVAVATSVAAVAFPGSASAQTSTATISFDGGLVYEAAAGQVNRLTVVKNARNPDGDETPHGSTQYTYAVDDVVPIRAPADRCSYPDRKDATSVVCTWVVEHGQDPGTTTAFRLGDQSDAVTFVNLTGDSRENDRFQLGFGRDTYNGTTGTEDGSIVEGEAGNDTIQTGTQIGALARVAGGSGNDDIRIRGDLGIAYGNAGNDVLTGGAGRQYLSGGAGNDQISGGSGDDDLHGASGNDTLRGDRGDDRIWGNGGSDKIYGGVGDDALSGGPGRDVVRQN